jgi:HEAT repeat protein
VDDLAAPYLDLLLPQLGLRQPERRARAVQTLSALGQRRYARQLEAALDDPSPLVAMVAARALARRESPDFAIPILRRMHRFGHWRASFLSSMLAAIGPAVAPTLRRAYGDSTFDPRVRAVAGDALRELNDYASADVAAEVLETAVDRDLIATSLGILAHMGRSEHLPAIRRRLAAPEPIIRARAVAALGSVGAEADHPALIAALADPSPWVALRAAEALRDARALPSLSVLDQANHPRAELVRQLLAGNPA